MQTTPVGSQERSWKQIPEKPVLVVVASFSGIFGFWWWLPGLNMWCNLQLLVNAPVEGTFPGSSMLPRTILAWSAGLCIALPGFRQVTLAPVPARLHRATNQLSGPGLLGNKQWLLNKQVYFGTLLRRVVALLFSASPAKSSGAWAALAGTASIWAPGVSGAGVTSNLT